VLCIIIDAQTIKWLSIEITNIWLWIRDSEHTRRYCNKPAICGGL